MQADLIDAPHPRTFYPNGIYCQFFPSFYSKAKDFLTVPPNPLPYILS